MAYFGALYPIYVRGEAYLAARQGAEAAADFQRVLDHRGVVINDPIGALARLQLGRALALTGNIAKAKVAEKKTHLVAIARDPRVVQQHMGNLLKARRRSRGARDPSVSTVPNLALALGDSRALTRVDRRLPDCAGKAGVCPA